MAAPKFKVGQIVDFNPKQSVIASLAREYKILRLMPVERGERQYRIKALSEAFERIANESDLAIR